ncbi:MAG: SAM-dependent methyltransferase [Mycobacterium sp.]
MPESSVVMPPEPSDGPWVQTAGLRMATTLFEQSAAVVPLPPAPHPVVIAEYGAGNARNGLVPIGAAVTALRKRIRPEHPIAVTHTDVPENDFSTLFRNLRDDPGSYLHTDRATYAAAVGRSYLQQILPSESVHLAWSAWAIHWLSRVPAIIGDHIQVSYSSDESVRAAYARQAAYDWHEFVAFRGRELSPGGRLVVLTMGQDEDGRFGLAPLLDALILSLAEVRDSGLITDDERRRMQLPVIGRGERDFRSPFAPSGRFERLQITHLELVSAPDRFWQQFQIDGDAKAFATGWARFARAATFDAFRPALGNADATRQAQVGDALEAALARQLEAAPEPVSIPVAHIVIEKLRR